MGRFQPALRTRIPNSARPSEVVGSREAVAAAAAALEEAAVEEGVAAEIGIADAQTAEATFTTTRIATARGAGPRKADGDAIATTVTEETDTSTRLETRCVTIAIRGAERTVIWHGPRSTGYPTNPLRWPKMSLRPRSRHLLRLLDPCPFRAGRPPRRAIFSP